MKKYIITGWLRPIFSLLIIIGTPELFAQSIICDEQDRIEVKGYDIVTPSYGLSMTLDTSYSTMHYCSEMFSDENGGAYSLHYVDEGGSGMDSYPNVIVGGIKTGGKWYPGDKAKVGMPVQIANISDSMNLEWIVSQEDAWDEDDKWMASINFIFDSQGTETSLPNSAERDYDLVIKANSHNFSDVLDDQVTPAGNRLWYFARNADGSLKPYELKIDGITYTYAVRYKFHTGTADKDDKVHLKFIPYGSNGAPEVLKVNLKHIIQATKDYAQYANMPTEYRDLVTQKVALDDTWLKGINAGYEVYTGESTLNIDKFKINLAPNQGELNAGFESGVNQDWDVATFQNAVASLTEAEYDNVYDGLVSAKLEVTDLPVKSYSHVRLRALPFDLSIDDSEVSVNVFAKSTTSSSFKYNIKFYDSNDVQVGATINSSVMSLTSSYTSFPYSTSVPDGADYCKVEMRMGKVLGTYYFDNFEFSAINNGGARIASGIEEVAKPVLSVYPNPATTQLNLLSSVNWKGNINISLISISGQLVLAQRFITDNISTLNLTLPRLKAGLYLLHVKSAQHTVVEKVYIK